MSGRQGSETRQEFWLEPSIAKILDEFRDAANSEIKPTRTL